MGRRPLPIGAHGNIKVKEVAPGIHEARCWYRDLNGEMRRPATRGPSETAAIYALQERLTELAQQVGADEISRDDLFGKAIDLWLADLELKVEVGDTAPTTFRTYRSYITGQIRPALAALRIREVKAGRCDKLIKTVRKEMGYESAKKVRTITSAVCDFAIRRGVENWTNPVKASESLTAGPAEDVVAMTAAQAVDMLQKMDAEVTKKVAEAKDGRARSRAQAWLDLPELAEAMLATGVRIGEVLALRGQDVVKVDGGRVLVAVVGHLIFVTGEGTRYVPGRKGKAKDLLLQVPAWSTPMFLRRKLAAGADGPLFPSARGGWLDTNNANKRIREVMDACGFEWVTSHVWRHTVGTLLDEADLPVGEITGQLGNTRAVAERHYIRRRVTNQAAAAALEVLGRDTGS